MIATAPVIPRTPLGRLRMAWADGWTVASMEMVHWVRAPEEVLGRLLFPVISIVLFGYVFGSAMVVPGGGNYIEFLMPGLFVMTMAFGLASTAVYMVTGVHKGVVDRFRSMPMARSAVVVGRSVADILAAALDLLILIVAALAIGWRWHGTLGEALLAIGLLFLLRIALIWAGIYLGLLFRNPEAASSVLFSLVFPFTMISNVFVAPELMPAWLGFIAEWNPISSTVTAARELFGNPSVSHDSWIARNALLMAVVWPVLLIVVFFPLSVRRYMRLSR
jgi:ABC-2 type transport system permease protein